MKKIRNKIKLNMPKDLEILISEKSTLNRQFFRLADEAGDPQQLVSELFDILPNKIKEAPAFLLITGKWHYDYGIPYINLPENTNVIGTPQWPEVKILYQSLKIAHTYLTHQQFDVFVQRLIDPAKHNDVLFEMRPLLYITKSFCPIYEVSGYGSGNKTIDWLIKPASPPFFLTEVKNREKSMIKFLHDVTPKLNRGEDFIIPPKPDPGDLFKSTLEKFKSRIDSSWLQGVWVQTQIIEDRSSVIQYFNKIDHTILQFLIISKWGKDAFVLTRTEQQKRQLIDFFEINESTLLDY
ncbi:MAG: hypothetical protein PHE84_00565 [bacterium]|nr:hypothetical protein [bacterium]